MENCSNSSQVKSSHSKSVLCEVRSVLQQRYKAPELGAYIILIDITPRSVRSNRVVHVRWNRTVSASSGTVHSHVTWEVRGGGAGRSLDTEDALRVCRILVERMCPFVVTRSVVPVVP
jgi:hypothetical protein